VRFVLAAGLLLGAHYFPYDPRGFVGVLFRLYRTGYAHLAGAAIHIFDPGVHVLVLGMRLALAIGLPVAHYVGALTAGSALDTAGRVAFWSFIEPPDMTYAAPVLAFLLGLFLTAPPVGSPAHRHVVRT
jgi:hypothetical protein